MMLFFFFFQSPRTHQREAEARVIPKGRDTEKKKKQQLSLAAKDERTQWTRPTEELP